jgi:excisionase family DNA binding protein
LLSKNKSVRRLDSISNAADYAGVCTKTIRRWIASGHLSAYRVGPKLIRVDLDQLDAMFQPIGGGA